MPTTTAQAMSKVGNITAATRSTCVEVLSAARAAGYTITVVWGMGGGSEHSTGRALDFMVFGNRAAGVFVRNYLWANRKRLHLRHVIWEQHITSTVRYPGKVRKMEDRGNRTENHYDHVHVLFDPGAYSSPAKSSTPAKAPAPAKPAPTPDKYRGTIKRQLRVTTPQMHGEDVRLVQRALTAYGVKPDGYYGPKTAAAVKAFQRRWWPHNREQWDGIVGPMTAKALRIKFA